MSKTEQQLPLAHRPGSLTTNMVPLMVRQSSISMVRPAPDSNGICLVVMR